MTQLILKGKFFNVIHIRSSDVWSRQCKGQSWRGIKPRVWWLQWISDESFAEEASMLTSDIFSNKPHVMKCYMTQVMIVKYSHWTLPIKKKFITLKSKIRELCVPHGSISLGTWNCVPGWILIFLKQSRTRWTIGPLKVKASHSCETLGTTHPMTQ